MEGSAVRQKVTIRDVAAAAGVSHQTVSRVINNRPDVAEGTRRRVWRRSKMCWIWTTITMCCVN